MFEFWSVLPRISKKPAFLFSKITNLQNGSSVLKNTPLITFVPCRTTVILKRRFPVGLYKKGNQPRIEDKHLYYELVENIDSKPDVLKDVVLTASVPEVGNPGDIVTMKSSHAHCKLLVPGFAVYPTPENLEYSRMMKKDQAFQEKQVPPSVELTMKVLEGRCISVVMNKETEWTLEPWHLRVSLRKAGVIVLSDSCIQLPAQPITGPNLDLEGKEFYITLTINKRHKVRVRCCLHHWSTAILDRMPYKQDFWLTPLDKMFPNEDTSTPGPTL